MGNRIRTEEHGHTAHVGRGLFEQAQRVLVGGAVPWHAAVLLGAFVLLTTLALATFEAREIGTGHSPLRGLLRRERRAAAHA